MDQQVFQQAKLAASATPGLNGILQRKCACGNHTIAGGECAECRQKRPRPQPLSRSEAYAGGGVPPIVHDVLHFSRQPLDPATRAFMKPRSGHDFSRIPVHARAPVELQTKLTVSSPGDAYEQEADHVASQIMRMPEPSRQRTCTCGGACSNCKAEQSVQEHGRLQTRAYEPTGAHETSVPSVVHEVLRSTGQPLDAPARDFFEARLDHDFDRVRVHADPKAARSAEALSASAYTLGPEIVFGHGQYAPHTAAGRTLLAHELVHVVQQSAAAPVTSRVHSKTPAPETTTETTRTQLGGSDTIQTRLVAQATNLAGFKELSGLTVRPLSVQQMIQRDFALPPPRPLAVPRVLSAAQVKAAIDFNNRVVGAAGADVIRELRDVLGISRDPAVIDEDFVNAVVSWQAVQGLGQDGRLGPRTAARLFREIGAEGAGEGRLKSGPTYSPGGTVAPTIAGGRESAHFALRAEFDSDPANGIFPSCCEVRQFIRWNATAAAGFGATGVPHAGFPAGTGANTWIEDRDAANNRYGHRSGPFSDPQSFDQYLDSTGRRNQAFGHIYRGTDDPGGPPASMTGQWRFMIRVIDVCKGGRTLGTEDVIRINW